MTTPLLVCDDVGFSYTDDKVLDGVSLSIEQGDLTGVIGPNGSGKTTLIKVLSGLLRPSQGEVLLRGKTLDSTSRKRIAGQVAVVAQEESSDFGFTVREEVMLGRFPHHGGLHFENRSDLIVVEQVMKQTGVAPLADRKVEHLSGGERQRVRLARALAQEPSVLLLDEPTNHLDLYSQLSLIEILHEINKEGIAILLVSHDINFVSRACREVTILRKRTLQCRGSAQEVITEENIASSFRIQALVDRNPSDGSPRMTPIRKLEPEE